jgi:hypothetical protein
MARGVGGFRLTEELSELSLNVWSLLEAYHLLPGRQDWHCTTQSSMSSTRDRE